MTLVERSVPPRHDGRAGIWATAADEDNPFTERNQDRGADPFRRVDPAGAANAFGVPREPKAKRQSEEQVSEQIAEAIQPTAEFRLQKLGARDLAIAAIKDAVNLINGAADDETRVSALQESERRQERQNENTNAPAIRNDRKLEEEARE